MKTELQTPQDIRQRIWKELGRASKDRHHAWRYPVLASVGRDGMANARTVVLRDVDTASQTLRIYTDARSPKVGELVSAPHAVFVFWSAQLNWQLRVRVAVSVETDRSKVDTYWQKIQQSAAVADYMGFAVPGSPYQETHGGAAADNSVNHFALLNANILEIDWLELGRSGHRRARLLADSWQWLTP